ncbi:hypothetical protein [Desulfurivibrio dismutans]|uniref:hypothetical protein n=1 Tax=Desulfurivibrio dismutans TaxID=1398908 RepID=UPI0023DAB71C|nr:hypothetical protein [Desulfurivibrio alkaliphilus]MDF1613893.1 hypothetical protein [Desulfurivibrio alkaliphilus]
MRGLKNGSQVANKTINITAARGVDCLLISWLKKGVAVLIFFSKELFLKKNINKLSG